MEFIHNAKNVQQDLIRLDWAIKREVVYKAQISEHETIKQRLMGELEDCQASGKKLATDVANIKQQLGEQTIKTKQAKLQIWAMRLAVTIYLVGKIKGILP